MFGALKKTKPALKEIKQQHDLVAQAIYSVVLKQVRLPVFYREYGVPDTLDGRFDLLVLHVFFVMNALCDNPQGADLNQALFDIVFKDMDQMLRESGIGDMGIPKHMRRMMQGFNGRVAAYQQAMQDKVSFQDALQRNVYNDEGAVGSAKLLGYAYECMDAVRALDPGQLMAGQVSFPQPREAI